ncbi:N-acetyltransferase [Streptomyces nigrescens]|uniref:N-acetyltransferase n=2 Tax=Streptomyces TaxID=1883 RepID=A0ABM8A1D4_STRNI|nr:GNAT family N-acetyltransferase [Streptomyces nigrescens]MEE4421741.1 GNAT family N-acetyltransferase [Streptomyces sp. DSM 41528]BDM72442.1 N-acetyltransferase [Streptomyces nigrescens]
MEFLAGGRAEVRITRADVGKRVSVRRLTGDREGGAAFTDAVGVLTSWDEGVLSITRRSGECVRIEESSLVAAKVVPAARPRRKVPSAGARELQEVAARGWPATETERLGEWTLRASGGFSRRGNSVLPVGDPGVPLDTALERIAQWYAARGLPPVIVVATGRADADEALAAELERRGWEGEAHTRVLISALAPLADTDADLSRVTLSREPDESWLALYNRTGDAGGPGPAALKVLTGGPSVWFATVRGEDGGAAAIGRLVVDGRWAGFAAVEVAAAQRRRGLASLVMAALAERALDEGASAAYLQVEADNAGALALYERLGFTDHHGYHYRRALPGGR